MLTERQQRVLEFIRDQQHSRGITPSTADIQGHFGFASPNAVSKHLQALERKGALKRSGSIARGIVLTSAVRGIGAPASGRRMMEIPIYGTIPAGLPTDATQEAHGCVSVDAETLRLSTASQVFGLNVRGDSMINAGIFSGDIVFLELREPHHGNIVAALIDGETTLKRYLVQDSRPFLKAENPNYPDLIPARELVIQGVQVGLLRITKP